MHYLKNILIEVRRFFSVLFMPWIGVVLVCLVASWYSYLYLNLDVLLAPLVKFWLFFKPLLFKTLSALFLWLWVNLWLKVVGWTTEITTVISALLGGWKAWSVKKLARQSGRFLLSLSARFVAVSVFFNLLFGRERRGVKQLPRFALIKLNTTWLGRVLHWWKTGSERHKRLALGLVLCLILVAVGQAVLGISVLLFDLVWELILVIWRWLLLLWRAFSPLLFRLLPNFIGNLITQKLIPFFVDLLPIIKDDHRVYYLRFNVRRHRRNFKAWLYRKSRERRDSIRKRVTPLVGERLRLKKAALLKAAINAEKSKETDVKDKKRD